MKVIIPDIKADEFYICGIKLDKDAVDRKTVCIIQRNVFKHSRRLHSGNKYNLW